MQLRYKMVNGMAQSTYQGSALGVFVIDADGTYRSASYPAQGAGRTHVNGSIVTFEGGAYPDSVGEVATTPDNFHIRLSENLKDTPSEALHFNDHLCYRKK